MGSASRFIVAPPSRRAGFRRRLLAAREAHDRDGARTLLHLPVLRVERGCDLDLPVSEWGVPLKVDRPVDARDDPVCRWIPRCLKGLSQGDGTINQAGMRRLRALAIPVVLKSAKTAQLVDQLGPRVSRNIRARRKHQTSIARGGKERRRWLSKRGCPTSGLQNRMAHDLVPQRFFASSDTTRRKAPSAAAWPQSRPIRRFSAPSLPMGPRAVIRKSRASRLSSPARPGLAAMCNRPRPGWIS